MRLYRNNIVAVLIGILCVGNIGFGFAQDLGTITVEVSGMESDEGVVRIALYKSKDVYENTDARKPRLPGAFPSYKGGMTNIVNRIAKWSFRDIPYGEYVVASYHDRNNNDILDAGLFGIPKEAFGFSNDARGIVGAPDYDEAKFMFSQKNRTVVIRVK